jgi:hypothetical protein
VLLHTDWVPDALLLLPGSKAAEAARPLLASWPKRITLVDPDLLQVTNRTRATLAPAKTRRPPVHLVALVLLCLIAVGGPIAEMKLPHEIREMLGYEVGAISLLLAIIPLLKQKQKNN